MTHDRQSQFEAALKEWHQLFSTASPDPIEWIDETHVFQRVVGSEFDVKSDSDSAGIQAIDIILWLYLQHSREAEFPVSCVKLMNYVFKHGWISDFSFSGVGNQVERQFGDIFRTPITPEQEAEARRLIELDEKRRLESMQQYERDGIIPFMRRVPLLDEAKAEVLPVPPAGSSA